MKKFVALILIAFTFTVFGCAKEKSPVERLIDEVIEVYGGEASLEKLNSYTSIWKMHVVMTRAQGEARVFVSQPDNLRVEIDYPTKKEVRIVRGNKGFKSYDDAPPRAVSGPQLKAMRLQLMRLYTPLTLKKLSKKGLVSLGEDRGYQTLTYSKDGMTVVYYVHPENMRIQVVVGTFDEGGNTMEFMTEYADFKTAYGMLFHETENKFAGGMNTAVMLLKELKTNQKHSGSLFK